VASVRARVERLGLNYAWGLINFAAGVALGGFFVGMLVQIAQSDLFK